MNVLATSPPPGLPVATVPFHVSRLTVTAFCFALVALIAWFDCLTGEYSMAVFYLVPVGLSAWYAGRWSGWLMAALSAVGWLAGDLALSHAKDHPLMSYWNAAVPALIYGVIVQLLTALRRFQAELEARVEQRTASLAEAHTELVTARMQLIEAEKLESIGRLAAGVAHEVKNPLMVISLVADYLSQVVPPSEPDGPAMIRDMREAVDRANRVISEMLEFARPSPLSIQPADFQNVAESALSFLKLELTRKHISVRLDWCRDAPQLPLDRHKMAQVLVNVFLNAIQAMDEGGTLSVTTRSTASEFAAIIDDTGPGIPAAGESRLFQPFFTTKPPGQGTGLGLSVARQIVNLHGGTLDLANRPGGGARVTLRLTQLSTQYNHESETHPCD